MKLLAIATLSFLVSLLAGEACGQVLWQNVEVGMSQGQVQTNQPAAAAVAKPDTLRDGSSCKLQIPSTEVGTDTYNVCFFFREEKLAQVTLKSNGAPSEGQFRRVVTLLRSKYGPEISLERTAIGHQADWVLPSGVNIAVLFVDLGGSTTRILNIVYQTRLSDAAKNL